MNYEDGDCGVGSFVWGCFQGVSSKNQEREHILFIVFYCAHHRSTQLLGFIGGKRLGEQGPYCQIQPFSEWNGALHLFRQNTAIMHSIRRSVLALTVTNHIQKSQGGGLHNLTAQTLTLRTIQANTPPPLTTVLKRGVEWKVKCTPDIWLGYLAFGPISWSPSRCHWSISIWTNIWLLKTLILTPVLFIMDTWSGYLSFIVYVNPLDNPVIFNLSVIATSQLEKWRYLALLWIALLKKWNTLVT